MSTDEILETLQKLEPFLELNNFVKDTIRFILWSIIRLFVLIADGISGVYSEIFKVFDILKTEEVKNVVSILTPVAWSVFLLALLYYAIKLMLFPETKIVKGFRNILFGIIVVTVSSTAIMMLVDGSVNITNAINGTEQSEAVYSIVSKNVYDLYKVDEEGTGNKETATANINKENISYLNISETIDRKTLKNYKDVLGKKVHIRPDGKMYVVDLAKILWVKESEAYYRYRYDWIAIAVGLIILISVYLMTSIKTAKLLFEMIYNYTLINVFALSDIENGEKLKKFVKNILNILLTIVLTAFMIYIFGIVFPLINNLEISTFAKMFTQIGFALAVIDGPVIIQELTGYDAGLKSTTLGAFGLLQAGAMVGKSISTAGKGITKAGKGIASVGKKAKDKIDELISKGNNKNGMDTSVKEKLAEKQGTNKDTEKGLENGTGGTTETSQPKEPIRHSNGQREAITQQQEKNKQKHGISEPVLNKQDKKQPLVMNPNKPTKEQDNHIKEAQERIRKNHGSQSHQAIVKQSNPSKKTPPKFKEVNLPSSVINNPQKIQLDKDIKKYKKKG